MMAAAAAAEELRKTQRKALWKTREAGEMWERRPERKRETNIDTETKQTCLEP